MQGVVHSADHGLDDPNGCTTRNSARKTGAAELSETDLRIKIVDGICQMATLAAAMKSMHECWTW